jgi:hypothetical protein
MNIGVIMYGSFRPPLLLTKSINSSQWLTFVYKACSWLGARSISLLFDTQLIRTMNVVFGHLRRLLLAIWLGCSPKSVGGHMLPRLHFFLASRIPLVHLFKNISTHYRQIQSAFSKLSNVSQVSNISKKSDTVVSHCRGPC